MNFDAFTPHEFTRFGGLVDNDAPTVLPRGVAAVCENCRFQLPPVATRYGLQTALQGPNQAAISSLASLIYTPENPGETLFQVPMVFDTDGYLLVEKPAGSGILVRVQGPLVSQPANAHAIVTDGGVTWAELTPVLVNRLPAPGGPQPTRVAGGGAFAAGRDVYLAMTYVNAQGESIASAPGVLVNTNLNDAAQFTVPALSSL